jgi:YHS domain-containing protein
MIMRCRILTGLLVALALGPALALACEDAAEGAEPAAEEKTEEKQETKPQTTCPLMGGKINKEIYADHEGKRVYFCCKGCIAAFKKDPAKYVAQLEEQGVELETVGQTVCPMSGRPVDRKHYADHDGVRVYFCGPGCAAAFKKDPAAMMAKFEKQGAHFESLCACGHPKTSEECKKACAAPKADRKACAREQKAKAAGCCGG